MVIFLVWQQMKAIPPQYSSLSYSQSPQENGRQAKYGQDGGSEPSNTGNQECKEKYALIEIWLPSDGSSFSIMMQTVISPLRSE